MCVSSWCELGVPFDLESARMLSTATFDTRCCYHQNIFELLQLIIMCTFT